MGIEQGLKIGTKAISHVAKRAYIRPEINVNEARTLYCKFVDEFNANKLISLENDMATNIKNYFDKKYIMHIFDRGKSPKAVFDTHASKIIQEIESFQDPVLEKEVTNLLIKESGGADFQIDKIIDCIHRLRGDYSSVGAHNRVQEILNMITNKAKRMDFKPQIEHAERIQALQGYITTYGKSYNSQNIAKHLYKNYYLKYNCQNADARELYRMIADNYGTMVFARNAENYCYMYAYDIREILKNWTEAAPFRMSVKLPEEINITELNEHFIKKPDCCGFARNKKEIYLLEPNYVRWNNSLDHEITHLNYTCQKNIPDLQTNPWYKQQLEILECPNTDYAITNGNELVASVMQCDLSKITEEFKDFLIKDLKVPDWMFNLKHLS